MEFLASNKIKLDKEINDLDKFAIDFCRVIEKEVKYIIISGYVSILFGRSRGTEDIDMFIERVDKDKFTRLYNQLLENGFECITAELESAFDNLNDGIAIRFSKGKQFIPNMEVKFAENELDVQSLDDYLLVKTSYGHLHVSHIEPQIAFKEVMLCSDKDLEDAQHLREVFKNHLDMDSIDKLKRFFKSVL